MRIGLDLIRFALPPLVNRMKSARTKGPRSTFAMLPVTDIISCAVNLLTSPVAFRYNEYLEVSRALYTNQSLAGSRRVSSNCGTNAATQRDAQAPPTFGAPLAREHPVDRPTRCPSAGRHRRTSTSSAASAPESHPRINHGTRVAASAAPSRSRRTCRNLGLSRSIPLNHTSEAILPMRLKLGTVDALRKATPKRRLLQRMSKRW